MMLRRFSQSLLLERLPPQVLHRRMERVTDPRIDTELFLVDLLTSEGQLAIDVGANRGLYAHAMRKTGARVIAFEPNSELTPYLHRLLGKTSTVVPVGLSNDAGESEFFVPVLGDTDAHTRGSLVRNEEPELTAMRSLRVLTMRLDDLGLSGVGLVKIDVEGHEMDALRGMSETLQRNRPNLIVESESRHDERNPQQLFSFLSDLGYDGFFRFDGQLHDVGQFGTLSHQNPTKAGSPDYAMNFIFVHRDRSPSLVPELERRVSSLLRS